MRTIEYRTRFLLQTRGENLFEKSKDPTAITPMPRRSPYANVTMGTNFVGFLRMAPAPYGSWLVSR